MVKLLKLTAVLLVACLLFTFLPSSASTDQIIAVQSSLRTQGNVASSWQVAMEMRDSNEDYTSAELGQAMVDFAVAVAVKYGNGVDPNTVVQAPHIAYATNKLDCLFPGCDEPSYLNSKYTCHTMGDFDLAYERFHQMLKGEIDHVHMNCHVSVGFIWTLFCPGIPYNNGCNYHAGDKDFIFVEVSSMEDVRAKACPGDIIINRNPSDDIKGNHWASHSQLWLGDITLSDGSIIQDAKMNCGGRNKTNDWVIKKMTLTEGAHYYIVPLRENLELFGGEYITPDPNEVIAAVNETGG